MLSVEKRLAYHQRVWVILEILRLLVVDSGGCAIPQLRLMLLAKEGLRLLCLGRKLTYPLLLFFLILPYVILRFEPWISGWMGSSTFKTIVTAR